MWEDMHSQACHPITSTIDVDTKGYQDAVSMMEACGSKRWQTDLKGTHKQVLAMLHWSTRVPVRAYASTKPRPGKANDVRSTTATIDERLITAQFPTTTADFAQG